eukprot:7004281-Prymnesium_polylepis.1
MAPAAHSLMMISWHSIGATAFGKERDEPSQEFFTPHLLHGAAHAAQPVPQPSPELVASPLFRSAHVAQRISQADRAVLWRRIERYCQCVEEPASVQRTGERGTHPCWGPAREASPSRASRPAAAVKQGGVVGAVERQAGSRHPQRSNLIAGACVDAGVAWG